jgi:two-component sensor histidine kinase
MDPRSLANPLVAGDFGLRFYAGVPLRTHDGFNLGTLCVIDREPRTVGEAEIAQLSDLAAGVMDELELRLSAKRTISEKEILFKEVHHRVKNNLQIVSSLLALQSRSAPAEVRAQFEESLRRIHAMGLLHERFYQEHQVESVDLTTYLGELLTSLIDTSGLAERVSARVEGPPIQVDLDAGTPLGLLAAEVILNACKHAFPDEREGEIAIVTETADGRIDLRICDNGIGHDPGRERPGNGMGQRLIDNFVRQLNGTFRFSTEGGTCFDLPFPHALSSGLKSV